MHIPTHFYYDAPSSEGVDFGITPTGVLSVLRLIANAPCWQNPCQNTDKRPKKLIITNKIETLINNFTKNKSIVLENRLKNLKDKGFEPLPWGNGQPYSVSNDQIIANILAHPSLNLTYDELLVLDENELNAFILGGEGDWPESEDFKIVNLQDSPISTPSLDKLLTDKADVIESLDLSGCINLSDAELCGTVPLPQLRELILQKKRCPMDMNLSNLSMNSIIQLIQRAPQLRSVVFNGTHYNSAEILAKLPEATLGSLAITNAHVSFDTIFTANTRLIKLNSISNTLIGELSPTTALETLEERSEE